MKQYLKEKEQRQSLKTPLHPNRDKLKETLSPLESTALHQTKLFIISSPSRICSDIIAYKLNNTLSRRVTTKPPK